MNVDWKAREPDDQESTELLDLGDYVSHKYPARATFDHGKTL